jgi:hypothetical protein
MRNTVKCLNCGKEQVFTEASSDKLGWHTTCNHCKGSFDIDITEYLIPNNNRKGGTNMLIRVILKENEKLEPIEYLKNQYGDIMYFSEYGEADEYLEKQGYTEEQIDKLTFEDCTVTKEEARAYLDGQGTSCPTDWLLNLPRQSQVRETVDNVYDLCDFDRWQDLQDILFKGNNKDILLDWESSSKIINILYEKDIEVLELK